MQAKCDSCGDKALIKTNWGFECAKCFLGKSKKHTEKAEQRKAR